MGNMQISKYNSKQSKHISELNEEELIEIFSYLSGSDLLNATLACQQWNKIISTSGKLLDKVEWGPTQKTFGVADAEVADFTRKYKHINLSKSDKWVQSNETSKICHLIAIKLENSLMTLKLSGTSMYAASVGYMAHCKFIRSLTIDRCFSWGRFGAMDRYIIDNKFKAGDFFCSLRHLEFKNSTPAFLHFIGCNQLDTFKFFQHNFSKEDSFFTANFLNQLDRCDEIELMTKIGIVNFVDVLQPKFLWRKMHFGSVRSGVLASVAIPANPDNNIAALLRASSANAEAKIILQSDSSVDWNIILSNCSKITRLCVAVEKIPPLPMVDQNLLLNLAAIRSLRILSSSYFNENLNENFVNFLGMLPNVTKLDTVMFRPVAYIPYETIGLLQPFFDQITHLTVSYEYDETIDTRVDQIFKIHFKKLNSVKICDGLNASHLRKNMYDFAQLNNTLRHLHITIRDISWRIMRDYLISLYNKLHLKTGILSCNIQLFSSDTCHFINWRTHPKANELRLFGKKLDENENRFFV